jgi:glycogen debranching enzyme
MLVPRPYYHYLDRRNGSGDVSGRTSRSRVAPVSEPWTYTGPVEPVATASGVVTLVEGAGFCLSGRSGDILPDLPHGLFFRDTRVLSRLELRVNGARTEPLAVAETDPFAATFVARARPRGASPDSTLLLVRSRYIGQGMREDLEVRNYGDEAAYCALELLVDVDFADLFAVKEGRVEPDDADRRVEIEPGSLLYTYRRSGLHKAVELTGGPDAKAAEGSLRYEVIVPARGTWRACVQVTTIIEGQRVPPRYRCGQPVERAAPAERLKRWRRQTPVVESGNEVLAATIARSVEDLGALRLFDPDYPDRVVVAAGAPWFMTLFGRDSLLTSYMALLVDPDLALGVLQTLGRLQGSEIDPRNEEQPGRILHEVRFGEAASLSLGGGQIYYGTIDATPLFVVLLGELRQWGAPREVLGELVPNADRALEWVERYGDLDGDGYVEYRRMTDRGLRNQGWKDSFDGIRFASGELAKPPIALCEVQGYVYAAYLARAGIAEDAGDTELAARLRSRASCLKAAFNRDFFLEEHGWFALGLDAEKRPIDALASNMGHCLWTGIVDEELAPLVAKRLLSPELFSGFGIRTLATSMGGYNPISYHCGSVWPHDSALAAAGLARYGFVEEAGRVVTGLLDAAAQLGYRLPELFSGLSRDEFPTVVGYPTSCSPQAWAAAAPLLGLRTLLRLDPRVPEGVVHLAPSLPEGVDTLRVHRVPLAGARVTVSVEADGTASIEGLPPGVRCSDEPAPR